MLSDQCKHLLYNWRFQQAANLILRERPTPDEKDLIRALARAYGDVTPFGGNQGEIVRAAVQSIIGTDYLGELLEWESPLDQIG